MYAKAEVRILIPEWLLDEAIDALQQDVGNVSDGELDLVIEDVVQGFLEAVASGDPRCPERIKLAQALRAIRARRRWRQRVGLCVVDLRNKMAASVVRTEAAAR